MINNKWKLNKKIIFTIMGSVISLGVLASIANNSTKFIATSNIETNSNVLKTVSDDNKLKGTSNLNNSKVGVNIDKQFLTYNEAEQGYKYDGVLLLNLEVGAWVNKPGLSVYGNDGTLQIKATANGYIGSGIRAKDFYLNDIVKNGTESVYTNMQGLDDIGNYSIKKALYANSSLPMVSIATTGKIPLMGFKTNHELFNQKLTPKTEILFSMGTDGDDGSSSPETWIKGYNNPGGEAGVQRRAVGYNMSMYQSIISYENNKYITKILDKETSFSAPTLVDETDKSKFAASEFIDLASKENKIKINSKSVTPGIWNGLSLALEADDTTGVLKGTITTKANYKVSQINHMNVMALNNTPISYSFEIPGFKKKITELNKSLIENTFYYNFYPENYRDIIIDWSDSAANVKKLKELILSPDWKEQLWTDLPEIEDGTDISQLIDIGTPEFDSNLGIITIKTLKTKVYNSEINQPVFKEFIPSKDMKLNIFLEPIAKKTSKLKLINSEIDINKKDLFISDVNKELLATWFTKTWVNELFDNLPADFLTNANLSTNSPIVINSLVKDKSNNTIKVNFLLTYAKIEGVDIYSSKGTSVSSTIVFRGFGIEKKWENLSNNIELITKPDLYEDNFNEPIRLHLVSFLEKSTDAFQNKTKQELLNAIKTKELYAKNVQILSNQIILDSAGLIATPTSPKRIIKINSSIISSISNDGKWNSGYEFTLSGYQEYKITEVSRSLKDFTQYTFEEFKNLVTNGAIGVQDIVDILNPVTGSVNKVDITAIEDLGFSKTIVSIILSKFHTPSGLITNYSKQFLISLKPKDDLPKPETDIFKEELSINLIDKSLKDMTAPLMIEYLSIEKNITSFTNILNSPAVFSSLFKDGSIPTGSPSILISSPILNTSKLNTIQFTITSDNLNYEIININDFKLLDTPTTFQSQLPSNITATNIETYFDEATSDDDFNALAKPFLILTNDVPNWIVKKAIVIKMDKNSKDGIFAYISFIISKVYVLNNTTIEIQDNKIIQFKYTNLQTAGAQTIMGEYISNPIELDQNNIINIDSNLKLLLIIIPIISIFMVLLVCTTIIKRKICRR